ncbi:MAG: diguanylate cyclase [Candidatus Methylomirabilia bacterium]
MAARDGAVRGRVLLVEDEDLLRWSIERFLSRRGLSVAAVPSGTEALALLASSAYDVVITDLGISDVDGLALAAEARRLNTETQVVIITGQGSKETILQALRQGVSDYVEKPFDLELLFLTVGKALEKTLILRELIQLARTDGLTGLYNQRHFYAVLEAEINRARRQSRALSLLLVDVDDFKRYNDRFGHLAGDAALARIASCLKRACRRDTDTAFRYGGDEFVLTLPETDRETAAGIAARVRSLLADEGIALTVSIGVAELHKGQDLKAFIREADQAMYRDKGEDAPGALSHAG